MNSQAQRHYLGHKVQSWGAQLVQISASWNANGSFCRVLDPVENLVSYKPSLRARTRILIDFGTPSFFEFPYFLNLFFHQFGGCRHPRTNCFISKMMHLGRILLKSKTSPTFYDKLFFFFLEKYSGKATPAHARLRTYGRGHPINREATR